ncbi:MAG: nucleoside deaminase [Paludibacteraceae bacterium]|nr:nucleoside deaminase [Candidatus Physcocola equi]MCQ2234476.1 nucleoside deaminase [Paludibacteraceae bacterium]
MVPNIDEHYMRLALEEAKKAEEQGEVPIGAIIVHQNTIVARAHNLTETLNDVTAHAEMQAITIAAGECGKYLNECTLYVTVEPCIMCGGAIGWAQVKKVVYGASDPKRGYSNFSPSPLHPKCEVVSGVLEEECGKIVSNFFKKKR